MRIVLLGGPGSGKGVQGPRLAAALSLAYLSSGQLARDEARRGTPLGRRLAECAAAGRLAPDDLIVETLRGPLRAAEEHGGWVLDGFPRTLSQMRLLDSALGPIDVAVYLVVSEDEMQARLLARGRPDDQSRAVIERRLAEFRAETLPVIEAYRAAGVLLEVDGEGSPDEVTERLLKDVQAFIG